jgi:adenylate kinase
VVLLTNISFYTLNILVIIVHRLVFRFPEMDEQSAPIVIVVLGPPGAGKGTQSSMLADLLRVPRISIGGLMRSYARDDSEVGLRLRGMMALGQLVPDTLGLDVLATRISEPDCARGLILDGFPRTLGQAELLERGLLKSLFYANNLRGNVVALHLRVQNSTIVEALSGRSIYCRCSATYHLETQPSRVSGECAFDGSALTIREDDHIATVLKRLRINEQETAPILSHYADNASLLEVDGEQPKGNIDLSRACSVSPLRVSRMCSQRWTTIYGSIAGL